jgi:hypothetical protein
MVTIGSQTLRFDFRRRDEVGVQRRSRPLERIRQQVTVGLPDLLDARPHEAGELEQADTGGDREARERMPQRIGGTVSGIERDGIPFLQAGRRRVLADSSRMRGKGHGGGLGGLAKTGGQGTVSLKLRQSFE